MRRRLAAESPTEIAEALGRTTRWVRKWMSRHDIDGDDEGWAESRSQAPHRSPARTPAELEALILAARAGLVANPREQYGSLAIQWELRRVGVEQIPPARTIERVLARAGVSRPRRRQPGYVAKGVPYPTPVGVEPGTTHQVDMAGPRHLFGAAQFHALNSPRSGPIPIPLAGDTTRPGCQRATLAPQMAPLADGVLRPAPRRTAEIASL